MFTGLVQELGRVTDVRRSDDGVRLEVQSQAASELAVGDSVAVNGVCLTAVAVDQGSFEADVINETLRRSSLREAQPGAGVNIELPMRAGDRFGGHVVQGHVDGVGTIVEIHDDGFARRVRVSAPADVMRYIVEKGSIAVDGISLTVAEIDDASFTVALIPETIARTNLADARPGTIVNLEVDVLAKYVEKLVAVTR